LTPAHQFPLGMSMTYRRRLAILEWARATDAFVLEDDYDSEYRYSGPPLPSLQGLDTRGRVLLTGSFSKLLFPSLRLGYLVVPPPLVAPLGALISVCGQEPPLLAQATLADFMAEGHFFRHLRKMRRAYAGRRRALSEAVADKLSDVLELSPSDAGLQAFARLRVPVGSAVVAAAAARDGLDVTALTRYTRHRASRDGLLLGFAAVDENAIRAGAERLARTLRPWRGRRRS
jgi:GntR family transcriptional regulator/MocR family aminotransferase